MFITNIAQTPGTITIDVKTALLCLLIIGVIVLVIYLIVAAAKLVKTLERTQSVLDDFEVVSKIASERTKQLDKLIEQMSKKAKPSQGLLSALPLIISAATQIAGIAMKKNASGKGQGASQEASAKRKS